MVESTTKKTPQKIWFTKYLALVRLLLGVHAEVHREKMLVKELRVALGAGERLLGPGVLHLHVHPQAWQLSVCLPRNTAVGKINTVEEV